VNGHTLHGRTWIGILIVVALIVGHVALFGFAVGGHLSVALAAGVLGLVALKVVWWKLRRRSWDPEHLHKK
jgi:hypothetical protein